MCTATTHEQTIPTNWGLRQETHPQKLYYQKVSKDLYIYIYIYIKSLIIYFKLFWSYTIYFLFKRKKLVYFSKM